ncbi:MAG: hypothetical protein KTR31_31395 [Myxococcales bacterium]|nr:hypothetical protein [Myxococcales bacterium]
MTRRYRYVGPEEVRERWSTQPMGVEVTGPADVRTWATTQRPDADGLYPATFTVDDAGVLRIEDYGHEHVACAGGGPVWAAGVLWFEIDGAQVSVQAASNQSTGFCPEPSCWEALAQALDAAGLAHPPTWSQAFTFRRCEGCGERNLVKDDWFVCGMCDAQLPRDYNFD